MGADLFSDLDLKFTSIEEHGDYTTNIALRSKKPKEEAKKIVNKLQKDKKLSKVFEKIEIAGPGFINFWLSKEYLLNNLAKIISECEKYGGSNLGKGKKVLVEYSSPNIAKSFSIGHLRSTIIGQAIYNLYKFLGYEAIGENHLGDWGTQFGMVIAQIVKKGLDIKKLTLPDLEQLYVEFNQEMEEDPGRKDEAKLWFKKLETGDVDARKIWKACVNISIVEFSKIYDLLGIKIENGHGESFYEDKIPQVITEAKKKGIATVGKEGAWIIDDLPNMPPGILIKSDGTSTYFTRDLAAIKYRLRTWNPGIFIYEVGSEQKLHFRQVFESARKLGWIKKQEMIHIAHGLIRFAYGKMSTRKGTTVKLEEILGEAIQKAKKFNPDPKVAQIVGIGAVKYFDLMHNPTSDIIFDWNKIFVLEGNSGPYLQYTYTRMKSVLAKKPLSKDFSTKVEISDSELSILRYLSRFGGIISMSAKSYSPNILCEYLFNLAQKYNNFYNSSRIIGSGNEEFRLVLTSAVSQVIENGLNLLGIKTPERM